MGSEATGNGIPRSGCICPETVPATQLATVYDLTFLQSMAETGALQKSLFGDDCYIELMEKISVAMERIEKLVHVGSLYEDQYDKMGVGL